MMMYVLYGLALLALGVVAGMGLVGVWASLWILSVGFVIAGGAGHYIDRARGKA